MKKKKPTVEGTYKTKNGIKRLMFCGVAILLQFGLVILFTRTMSDVVGPIKTGIHIVSIALALWIYSRNQTSSMKMPWIMLMLVSPVIGVTLYLLIGLNGVTRRMRERYVQIDQKLFPMLPEQNETLATLNQMNPKAGNISNYLKKVAGFPVYQNTKVKYHATPNIALEELLEDLSRAQKYIFMEYHAIEDDVLWARIQAVLEERAKAGVEVYVFYDDMGSIWFVNDNFYNKMEEKGIHCRVFNPFMPGINVFLNNRDHRKITVIDGKIGYTGGYNLANEYFEITMPYGHWKDTGVRLEGEAVATLTILFLEMWNAVKDNDTDILDVSNYLIKNQLVWNQGYVQPYGDSPLDREQVGEEVYISMLNKAERYCYFMTPYLIITDEMNHAMCLASKRGVDVRIITPGIPDKKMVYGVTRSFYYDLIHNGVRIYEWTPGFCHAKMCVVDDVMATCGTINLDYRSLYHHFENGCFFADCDVVGEIKKDFFKTMEESREVTDDYRAEKGKAMKLRQIFWRLFAGLL